MHPLRRARREGPETNGHTPNVVPIPTEKFCRVRLHNLRIFAVHGPPDVLQQGIHFPQVHRRRAIGLDEEGDRGAKVQPLIEPPIDCTLLGGPGLIEPIPPRLEAVFVPAPLLFANAALHGCA